MNNKINILYNFVNEFSAKNIVWEKENDLICIKRNKKNIYIALLILCFSLFPIGENLISNGLFFDGIISPLVIISIILIMFFIFFIYKTLQPIAKIDNYNRKIIYKNKYYYFSDIKNITSKFYYLSNYQLGKFEPEGDSYYIFIKLKNNKKINIAEIKEKDKSIEFKKLLQEYLGI